MLTAILLTLAGADGLVDFRRDVRPILSDKCFACHGPDEAARQADLRLDNADDAFADRGGYAAVVAGDPDTSEIVLRITAADESMLMPPPDAHKGLSAGEIAILKRWVEQGGEYRRHWAFEPLTAPPIPKPGGDWARGDIDRFVAERLDAEGLSPSAEADRQTLIRRVTLDLTGLPPTPAEVDAFLADTSEEAYAALVERLLASPRFGEHMARYWLDAARYGDTHGLHLDNFREMWAYRDWVVAAFNGNKPFDAFVTEQLAGDLLPSPTDDQLIASGFNRCNVTTSEGGSIAAEVQMRNVVDRTDTFGEVFLGLTVGCARCHDHKFDPVSQREYYQLYAYFNSFAGNPLDGNAKDHAPVLKITNAEQDRRVADLERQLRAHDSLLAAMRPRLDDLQRQWEISLADGGSAGDAWHTLVPDWIDSAGASDLKILDDSSVLAGGPNPDKDTYTLVATLPAGDFRTVQLEAQLHESQDGPGRADNGNAVLTDVEIAVAGQWDPDADDQWRPLKVVKAWADHEQPNGDFRIENVLDGKDGTGWAVEGYARKEAREARFVFAEPFGEDAARIRVTLKFRSQYARHAFGRVRLSVGNDTEFGVPDAIRAIATLVPAERTDEQRRAIGDHFRSEVVADAEYVALRDGRAAVAQRRQEFQDSLPTTLVYKETPQPRQAHVLVRGEYDQPGEPVERAVPQVLPPLPSGDDNDRMALARWLTEPSHPLTARVAVNRFWQQLFGRGLVLTSGDFGAQGTPPSHPELLDHLAAEFASDWDVKGLMRRLVTSAAYRQSSAVTPELLERDPANVLLARGPRFRLDAEVLRDQALAIGGLLVERLGGPSVKPPQPDGLWKAVGYSGSNTVKFVPDTGAEKVHRRTLYTFIKRTSPPPQMSTFDAPSRESCTVRRERTNTPLQALLLFNDPQYVEAARGLAERALQSGIDDDRTRMAGMFRTAVGRQPDTAELAGLLTGLEIDRAYYERHPQDALALVKVGSTPPPQDLETRELAVWTLTANILLSLDEVVTKN